MKSPPRTVFGRDSLDQHAFEGLARRVGDFLVIAVYEFVRLIYDEQLGASEFEQLAYATLLPATIFRAIERREKWALKLFAKPFPSLTTKASCIASSAGLESNDQPELQPNMGCCMLLEADVAWGSRPMIIVFDGVCNVCNRWVQFVIAHDRRRLFRFAPAQTPLGRRLMTAAGVSADRLDSIVLFDGARYFTHSDAVLRILGLLRGWPAAFEVLRVLPRGLRDRCYDAFAQRRYRLFGRRDACVVPEPGVRDRFLA